VNGVEGMSPQLLGGWHQDDVGRSLWSMQTAFAVLRNPGPSSCLIVHGLLPPPTRCGENALRVECDGQLLGFIRNYSDKHQEFRFRCLLPNSFSDTRNIRFFVEDLYCPAQSTGSSDRRGLGFALYQLSTARLGIARWSKVWLMDAFRRIRLHLRGFVLNVIPTWIDVLGCRLVRIRRFIQHSVPDDIPANRPGLSIVVSHTGEETLLDACLRSIQHAVRGFDEPIEITVVSDRLPEPAYFSLPSNIHRRWNQVQGGRILSRAISKSVRSATHDWVYCVSSGYVLEESALRELLQWRAPHVFAVGSAMGSQLSGWMGINRKRGLPWPEERKLDSAAFVRGSLGIREDAALFNRTVLQKIQAKAGVYNSSEWESLEWCVRSWRSGFETLFCPASRVHPQAMKTTRQSVETDSNGVRFLLRNSIAQSANLRALLARAFPDGAKAHLLSVLTKALTFYVTRWREASYAFKAFPLDSVGETYYIHPPANSAKPNLIFVSPYVLFPPSHGSAVGMTMLLDVLKQHYTVHILSDESSSYGPESLAYFSQYASVRLLTGRLEGRSDAPRRIARMQSHSHPGMRDTLAMLISNCRPRFVEIEHVELAKLVELRHNSGAAWILDLHDVFLSGTAEASAEDRYELGWIDRYDALICCSVEDASLLGRSQVTIVPNTVDLAITPYEPSPCIPRILFVGPARSPQNFPGIREFLERVYPGLAGEMKGLELWIVGGKGALKLLSQSSAFRQEGIRIFEYVEDMQALLRQCALTINPISGNRGACRKVVESLASGRVCLSTREGARGYLQFEFPSLVTCDQVADFAAPLRRLLQDVDYRRSLERLDDRKRYYLSREYAQQQLLALYESLERKSGC
jgi:hypothetical protein